LSNICGALASERNCSANPGSELQKLRLLVAEFFQTSWGGDSFKPSSTDCTGQAHNASTSTSARTKKDAMTCSASELPQPKKPRRVNRGAFINAEAELFSRRQLNVGGMHVLAQAVAKCAHAIIIS
jgi:hypothetical protein